MATQIFLPVSCRCSRGEDRFQLDMNTKELVLQGYQNTEEARQIKNAIDARKGLDSVNRRNAIGLHISQATSLVRVDKHTEAEETLLKARNDHPDHPDLCGVLGWVYKNWKPEPRYTDARIQFTRAYELHSSNEEMYKHWSEMEQKQRHFSASAEVAEKGMELVKNPTQLSLIAGVARSRFARNLYGQVQYDRAKQEAEKAMRHLNSLTNDDSNHGSLQKIFRAHALNYELLADISRSQNTGGAESHFLRLLSELLERWGAECPDDPLLPLEQGRIREKFSSLRE